MAKPPKSQPVKRKFKTLRAGSLLSKQIGRVAESRGFAHARLLTEWEAIVGAEIARLVTPLKVGYSKRDLGATLHVTVRPGAAPEVQMQERLICERVNTCYGYNAVTRLRIVSAGPPQKPLPKGRLRKPMPPAPPEVRAKTAATLADVKDPALRRALEALGYSINDATITPEDRT